MSDRNESTLTRLHAKWREIRWKLFLVWAVLIAVAVLFVILPVLMSAPA